MDYEFKANLTTVLCFLLFPVLAGLGVDSVTSSAVVGVLVAVLGYVLLFFNERYLSKWLTHEDYEVVNTNQSNSITQDNRVLNQEYDSSAEDTITNDTINRPHVLSSLGTCAKGTITNDTPIKNTSEDSIVQSTTDEVDGA